jgi:D-alanyl-D-alanine carboxypeptidase-like protein
MGHHRRMRRFLIAAIVIALLVPIRTASAAAPPYRSSVRPLSAQVRALMRGSSWHRGCPVHLYALRLVRVTYWGFDRQAHRGRLVVHRTIAHDVARTFGRVYAARFPIRKMKLVDRFGADDMRSMEADNTSAFNCRYRNGVCCTWSMHAYGKAIDIDPVENPEIWSGGISPPNGARFADRSNHRRGMIVHGDAVWSAFHAIGWGWGGGWSWPDYQHFSTNGK